MDCLSIHTFLFINLFYLVIYNNVITQSFRKTTDFSLLRHVCQTLGSFVRFSYNRQQAHIQM